MCSPVRCNICGKTTWAGCGQHVDQVKARVAAPDWCDKQHTPEQLAAAKQGGSFFGR